MKLKMFLADEFQPAKGSIKISTKGTIEGYRERYDKLAGNASVNFRYDTYAITPGDRKIVHIKVPSETLDKFTYDVLLELSAEKGVTSYEECDIKVFSNCPSFVFSVAYVFAHWDPDAKDITKTGKGMMIDMFKGKLPRDRMLIPGTEGRLGKRPIKEEPVTRNPMGVPLFDKSVYYAIFYMMDNIPFNTILNNHHYRTGIQVFNNIQSFESLMAARKREENRARANKKKEQKSLEKDFIRQERTLASRSMSKPRKPVSPTRASGATRTPSKPRTMKHIGTKR